ncbi:MAG: ankyrin repeat domain-containing protein [Phycisphaerales bacterium]|nr:MAG: ankyrin repeat domain-containing protein [Phycisphaerales bacterium]
MTRLLVVQVAALIVLSASLQQAVATAAGRAVTLHQMATQGNLERVKSLVEGGADINAQDRQGWTPLQTAIRRQQKEIAEYLVEKGADVKIADSVGQTALHVACFKGSAELTTLLIGKGADINARDRAGQTPLHFAAEHGWKDVVEVLIAKGADVNLQTPRGENALSKAERRRQQEVVELLLQHGAKEPTLVLPADGRYYGDSETGSPYPNNARQVAPRGRQLTRAPATRAFVLGDPNEIKAKIKEFPGLQKGVDTVVGKSTTVERSWLQRRMDNRTSLARAVQTQAAAELAFIRTCAVEEKAEKTTKAIDDVLASRKKRSAMVDKELQAQRREQRLSGQDMRGRGRGRMPSRGARGRYQQQGRSRGGLPAGAGSYQGPYAGRGVAPGTSRSSTGASGVEPLDPETENQVRDWTSATTDNRTTLARSVHDRIWAEMTSIREVAVAEEAKKTTAAIDGVLLSRQERLAQRIAKMEEARRSLTQPQGPRGSTRDPRMRGQQGYMQDGGAPSNRRPGR